MYLYFFRGVVLIRPGMMSISRRGAPYFRFASAFVNGGFLRSLSIVQRSLKSGLAVSIFNTEPLNLTLLNAFTKAKCCLGVRSRVIYAKYVSKVGFCEVL